MMLFYCPDLDTNCTLPTSEAEHAIRVLRLKEGDTIQLTNGKGLKAQAEIVSTGKKEVTFRLLESMTVAPTPPFIHLAVAPTKNMDRMEWLLEKATEIGLHSFTPILCQRSERKVWKEDRIERIVLSALKQSGQYHLPILHPITSFDDYIKLPLSSQKFIAHCVEHERISLTSASINLKEPVYLLIGPEGDFSNEEIEKALKNGFQAVQLGSNRLRTETAALHALSLIHSLSF